MPDVLMDELFGGGGQIQARGGVAKKLLANSMNPGALRSLDTLLYDEWKKIDSAVVEMSRLRLVGVADLITRGLTYPLPNALGTTVLAHQLQSDISDAVISMDAVTPASKDRPDYSIAYLPIPVIHKDFGYNIRELSASRNGGSPLDTTTAALAGLKVAECLETLLFKGTGGLTFASGTIYGYENYTYTNSYTLAAAWTATAADPVADIRGMKQASITDRHNGPWMAYVSSNWETVLDDDYSSSYPGVTIRDRIMKVDGIIGCKVSDMMTASRVLLVEMTPQTVQLVDGMQPTNIEWDTMGGLEVNFKVMSILVPRLRSDKSGRCGIILGAA